MHDPRAPLLLCVAVVASGLGIPGVAAGDSPPAHAEAEAPGKPALERARAAWDKGDYDIAEPLYAESIERGGLSPAEVLEAYVHLGAARAVLGKKPGALAAFKGAALLDPSFAVPADVGKRALAVADQARRQGGKSGPVSLHAEIPTPIPAKSALAVDVTLDPAHAAVPGSTLGIVAREPESGASHVASTPAAPTAHFDLPPSLSLPSTTLQVRVDWMDAHANRLASLEEQVHVQPLSAALISAPLPPSTARDEGAHRGFWHSAWPYILGGAALAAGGVAVYFATRSGGDVNVTGVRVVTH